jgi:hypothetical protein
MYKLHVSHRESGYIATVEYEETTDTAGALDWEMFYTPGPKALAEYEAFTNRRAQYPALPVPGMLAIEHQKPQQPSQAQLGFCESDAPLLNELIGRGIAEKKARELLMQLKPSQEVMDQLEYVDSLVANDKKRKLQNPPGLYVCYIRDNIAPPRDFWSTRKAKLHEQAQQARDVEGARRAQLELAYEEYRAAEIERFITADLPAAEYRKMFEQHKLRNRAAFRMMTGGQIDTLTEGAVRAEMEKQGRVKLLSLRDFAKATVESPLP